MTYKDAEGNEINIGDMVEFKADCEQIGKVVEIRAYGQLVIENKDGFGGDYIGGETRTTESADRVYSWTL